MKIAIVQDGPVYLNLNETIEKTKDIINDVSKLGVDLVVFGESWMSGYPVWLDVCSNVNLWDHAPVKAIWAKTFNSSIEVHSPEFEELSKTIKDAKVNVVIGANESVTHGVGNGTIYNSVFTFSRTGELVNHHRKLMPTFTEKLVHGLGDGKGLKAIDTDFGRLGSLICWEHWMPLTRQAMHDQAEDLHIALWPFAKDLHHVASRHYAHEGRCVVVAVGQMMHESELPAELVISPVIKVPDSGNLLRGGSAIYGANGQIIKSPLYDHREIIIEEVDLSKNRAENMNLAVSGHYQRNDVFEFKVNTERKQ